MCTWHQLVSFYLASAQSSFDQPQRLPTGTSHSLTVAHYNFQQNLNKHHGYRSRLQCWQAFPDASKVLTSCPLAVTRNHFRKTASRGGLASIMVMGVHLQRWQAFTCCFESINLKSTRSGSQPFSPKRSYGTWQASWLQKHILAP